ncbi:adaptin ear-binding coat-associated protein 1 NECAP-1 [Violaceomyces palustris]|uniref:Adaptin ear-binding coat-associated protein 1 NECAP-1 n=1 Tax=Violaceomyces palustris TaxID=1673888 RepID=A0ACD0P3U8_9BASI|nr:adaptin ear-binding coat-associated protein 1 NECAP-1 [Violaceomyces palustris]
MSASDPTYESVLFVARECFVYRVPPRTSTAGYKAGEWGDMEAFLWKGRLRVMEKGSKCEIRLEDSDTGELFALSPYDISGTSVEPVLDSSRYFVLRVESDQPSGGKKKAYIGMGFQDRSDSFDFNVALQDWTNTLIETFDRLILTLGLVRRQKAAAAGPSDDGQDGLTGPSPHIPAGPKKDFSLKEGETFSIKLPGGGGRKIGGLSSSSASASGSKSSGGGVGFGGLLPPPPSKRG